MRKRLIWFGAVAALVWGSLVSSGEPVSAATGSVTDVWRSQFGTLGPILVRRFGTGNGVLATNLVGLRSGGLYLLRLARDGCTRPPVINIWLRATSTGRIARTLPLTAAQIDTLAGRPAVRFGSTCHALPHTWPAAAPAPPASPVLRNIDVLLRACPTAAEVAAIRSDLTITFQADPTAGTLVCRASEGSVDLTQVQVATYDAILSMRWIAFDAPLPWTTKPLYDWLLGAIKGIRVSGDETLSHCCEPGPTIVVAVQPTSYIRLTRRWIDPQSGGGILDVAALIIHEARHADHGPHTCGTNDATLSEYGAWGVQYEFLRWIVEHTAPGFIGGPDEVRPGYYAEIAAADAAGLLTSRFCSTT